MMTQKSPWWQIYLMGAIFVGLLLLVHFAFSDITARRIAQIGIVLIGYRLILAWIESQARVFERQDRARLKAAERDVDILITERQAFYRLALSRRDAQLQKRR